MNDEHLDPDRLRRLQDAVAALPRSIEPSRDAWPAIRNRIEAERVRAIAPHQGGARGPRPRRFVWFAAAAMLLVTVSSGVTILLLRGRSSPPAVATQPEAAPMPEGSAGTTAAPVTPVTPVTPRTRVVPASAGSIGAVFSRYDAAAADLAGELSARRARMDPRTVAVLDSCIRRIDAAIAEARSALRQDPGNAVITELLVVSYKQKLDLLKRAADLPAASLQD